MDESQNSTCSHISEFFPCWCFDTYTKHGVKCLFRLKKAFSLTCKKQYTKAAVCYVLFRLIFIVDIQLLCCYEPQTEHPIEKLFLWMKGFVVLNLGFKQ